MSSRLLKTVVILINMNFIIFSFVLILFGISEKSSEGTESFRPFLGWNDKMELTDSKFLGAKSSLPTPSNILITSGIITITLGLYGLRSVDSYCLILSYTIFVTLLSLVDFSIGISASFMEASAEKTLRMSLSYSLNQYNISSDQVHLMWDRLQMDLKCCGVKGVDDWAGISFGNPKDYQVHFKHYSLVGIPTSCFQEGEEALLEADLDSQDFVSKNVYTEGCLTKSLNSLGIGRVQRVGFILAAAKTCAAISSSFLAHNIRNSFKAFV